MSSLLVTGFMIGASLGLPQSNPTERVASGESRRVADTIAMLLGSMEGIQVKSAPMQLSSTGFLCRSCIVHLKASARADLLSTNRFVGGRIVDLPLHEGVIEDLEFDGTDIERMQLADLTIRSLRIVRSQVTNLEIRNVRFNRLEIRNSSIRSVTINGGSADQVLLHFLRGGLITIRDGDWQGLSVEGDRPTDIQVIFENARLRLPSFSPDVVGGIDFTRAGPHGTDFRLLQDELARQLRPGNFVRRRHLLGAQVVYGTLARRLREAGAVEGAIEIEKAQKSAALESIDSSLLRGVARLWHIHMRGDFGLSPRHIVVDAGVTWLIFTVLFLALNLSGLGWAARVPLDLNGQPRGDPTVLRADGVRDILHHLGFALAFSADRLLYGATRLFQIEQLLDTLRSDPSRYVGLGFGRIVGGIESIVGVFFIVNLIQAIARST